MKIFKLTSIIFVLLAMFIACKKDNAYQEYADIFSVKNNRLVFSYNEPKKINEFINSLQDEKELIKFNNYLEDIKFKNLNSLSDIELSNLKIKRNSLLSTILNEDGIIQIKNTVLRVDLVNRAYKYLPVKYESTNYNDLFKEHSNIVFTSQFEKGKNTNNSTAKFAERQDYCIMCGVFALFGEGAFGLFCCIMCAGG